MNSGLIKIKAKLTLYSSKVRGRKTPIKSGYKPNHVFEYRDNAFKQTYIGKITFDKDYIYPGESSFVFVEFVHMLDIKSFISIGRKWWIHEAKTKLGEAEIIEIIQ